MWMACDPSPSTGGLALLQKMTDSCSIFLIVRSLSWNHAHRFLGVFVALGFLLVPEMAPDSNCVSLSSLTPSSATWALLGFHNHSPFRSPPPSTCNICSISHSQCGSCIPLEFSLLLSIFGSVDFRMVILYIITNIHLKVSNTIFAFLWSHVHNPSIYWRAY